MDAMVDGFCDPDYLRVRDAFEANFAQLGEVGAAVCVYADGRPVVDLWAASPIRKRAGAGLVTSLSA